MRNENLKNELNNLPQDFDREALWNEIERPKRKKRRFIFWFFGGFLFLLLGILYLDSRKSQELEIASALVDETAIKDKNENSIWKDEEPMYSNEIEDINGISQTPVLLQNENNTSINKNVPAPESYGIEKRKENVLKPTQFPSDATNEGLVAYKEEHQQVFDNAKTQKRHQSVEFDESINLSRNLIEIVALPQLVSSIMYENPISLSLESKIAANERLSKGKLTYGMSFASLIGRSNHTFGSQQNSSYRENKENGLESISALLTGFIQVNNWQFFSGLSFSSHNTRFESIDNDYEFLNGLNNTTFRNITTSYTLYNAYQHLDLTIGVGYIFSLNAKWRMQPELQLGYTTLLAAKGEILEEGSLISLYSYEPYNNYSNWQGQANLKLSRSMNKNWSVGFMGYWRMDKVLARLEQNMHDVNEHGLGLFIERKL